MIAVYYLYDSKFINFITEKEESPFFTSTNNQKNYKMVEVCSICFT